MLVLLDNARDAEQVRPLLPAAPGCLAIITSRSQLASLAATDGAELLRLELLPTAQAHDLLSSRLGRVRVDAEPAAAQEIIDRCARLPLALAIVAARAAAHPDFPLHSLAAELREAGSGLDALATGDTGDAADVRTAFSSSYRAVSPDAAGLFRLLGLHPGPDISAPAAASLAGCPARQVRRALAELSRAHLIVEHSYGRYAFHDLLRAFAGELGTAVDSADARHAAIRRLLDHYLATAHTAALQLNPNRPPIALITPGPGAGSDDIGGHDQAMDWFTAELPVLLAAIQLAAGAGLDPHAWQLAWTLSEYLDRRGRWHDWVGTQLVALAAARRLADEHTQARVHRTLGIAYNSLSRPDQARTHVQQALDSYRRLGDRVGQANAHHSLARIHARQGDHGTARQHASRAVELYQAAGHQGGQADALNALGWYHAQLGDYDQAIHHCRRALTLHEKAGHLAGQAGTWDSLGYTQHQLGDHQTALASYRRAIALFRDAGDRYEQAATLRRLGDTHDAAADTAAAREAWQHALDILTDLNHPDADGLRGRLN
jgi:tetratricopeptide (TPR) repeat protein